MNTPNLSFLIVGAAKSGTTFLANYLNKHPDIFIPQNELRFFSNVGDLNGVLSDFFIKTFIRTKEDYHHFFKNTKKTILGEKSPCYLYYYEESIKNIKKYHGDDIKIIIMLRNPIERAFSQYKHSLKYGYENISFKESLDLEEERITNNWYYIFHHRKVGLYYESVKAYLENFKNVKICFTEVLKDNKDIFLSDIYDFLGVDKIVGQDESKLQKNEGLIFNNNFDKFLYEGVFLENDLSTFFNKYLEKYKRLLNEKIYYYLIDNNRFNQFVGEYKKNITYKNIELPDDIRLQLKEYYKDDVKKMEGLLSIDLSTWLK